MEEAYKVFANINSLQTKVNEVLLQLLRYEIQDIGKAESMLAVSIVHDLNNDSDSVFREKIKVFPDDKNTWIKAPSFARFLKKFVAPGGLLQAVPRRQASSILKNYFRAIKAENPRAWGNNKAYVLTKAMGIEITSALFTNAYLRCQKFEKQKTDVDSFRKELKRLGKIRLTETGDQIEVDWSSKKFGALSSHKGIAYLKDQILLALPPT
jgi:hypothetical protein